MIKMIALSTPKKTKNINGYYHKVFGGGARARYRGFG